MPIKLRDLDGPDFRIVFDELVREVTVHCATLSLKYELKIALAKAQVSFDDEPLGEPAIRILDNNASPLKSILYWLKDSLTIDNGYSVVADIKERGQARSAIEEC